MAATVETRELFPKAGTTKNDMKELAKLRLKAGAITSVDEVDGDNRVLIRTWNLFGQQ